ncbi:MAG: nickel/cobalt transporter (NicO) family protein [Solirubrobacteraceae bacterium]|nr:nickel/cobalt transporter (NicO) family protein [Solirubrobacteraceae bacterium]
MRRLVLAVGVLLALPAAAGAHPLGNFSVNHLEQVRISADRVDVRYVLDQAEIPTFQERGLAPAAVLARKRAEVRNGLALTVDGRAVALRLRGPGRVTFPAGQGGLKLTRVELALTAPAAGAREVRLTDDTFPGRVGWKAMQVLPGEGTAVRTQIPRTDPTGDLRRYPKDLLSSPADTRRGTFAVRDGGGTVDAPGAAAGAPGSRSGDGLAGVFDDAAGGRGVLLFLLLVAFGWGALHALSPGHGKTMVAAYLVGTRGTPRHAALLGLTVTVTHTIGVFALGFVTLALSEYMLPEQIYPWLQLASGLLVLGVGAAVLRSRARAAKHHHHHHHHHHGPDKLSARSLVAMGASAGLLPCPSALVVLLSAIAQHQVGLGLVLIVAFSLGLAATLVGLGIAVISAGRLAPRLPSGLARIAPALPAVSAVLIVVVGGVLTAQSLPAVIS